MINFLNVFFPKIFCKKLLETGFFDRADLLKISQDGI